MSESLPVLTLSPLVIPGGPVITSLRLFPFEAGVGLALLSPGTGGRYPLSAMPLTAAGPGPVQHLRDLDSPFGAPFWDVAASGRATAAVWTVPGSAICPLNIATGADAPRFPDGSEPGGVYQYPRFWRGTPEAGMTATVPAVSGHALAAIAGQSSRGPGGILPLAGSGLLLDGLLLAGAGFYLMLTRLRSEIGLERLDLRGESIQSGRLHCLRLDRLFRAESDFSLPLGSTPVLDFDADISAGRVVVLATTETGYVTVLGEAGETKTTWSAGPEVRVAGKLLSPAVLAQGDRASAAMIVVSALGTARILAGEIRFPSTR